jgi:hypothetical protein
MPNTAHRSAESHRRARRVGSDHTEGNRYAERVAKAELKPREGTEAGQIPLCGTHRGVGLHDQQSPARLDVVKAELDIVIDMVDLVQLVDWARDIRHAPEGRLLAGAKAQVILVGYGEERQKRPKGLSVELVKAYTAGLNSQTWRDRHHFCSLLCAQRPPGEPGAVPREVPLRK